VKNRDLVALALSLLALGIALYNAGFSRGFALSEDWRRMYDAERERREFSDGRADRLLRELNECRTCLSDDPKGCR
jgi:hypothetical protein